MTRINVVPVQTLKNDHLLAEYKEITRPFNKVIKRLEKGKTDINIPKSYRLGSGHETFFFDKLKWLYNRYHALRIELIRRGFKIDLEKYDEIRCSFYRQLSSTQFWNDWQPTPEDMYLNMARLCVRSNMDNVLDEIRYENI